MLTKAELKNIMAKHTFHAKKRLGQNFLVDDEILKEIIESSKLKKEEIVIEIGAGFGALTRELSRRAGKVVAVEIDKSLCKILREKFSKYENLEIVCGDILKFDIQQYLEQTDIWPGQQKAKVIGNPPYYITTPIITYLLERRSVIETILITIQEEVARRLIAKPATPDYGAISCFVQFYTKPSLLVHIRKEAFFPQPKVDSCLVKFDVLAIPSVWVCDEDLFFRIIRSSFAQRRKILLNSLSSGKLNLSKGSLMEILKEAGIDPNRRGETLGLEEFSILTNLVKVKLSS